MKRSNPYQKMNAAKRSRSIVTQDNRLIPGIQRYRKGWRPDSNQVIVVQRTTNELKGMDTHIENNIIAEDLSSNDDIWALNLVAPGNGSFNRIGKSIINKSIRLKGIFHFRGEMTQNFYDEQCVRWSVVWDKSPNSGTYPKWDDIFCNTFYNGDEKAFFESSLRFDNTGRFTVLKEGYIDSRVMRGTVTPFMQKGLGGGIEVAETVKPEIYTQFVLDEYIDLKNKKTIFSTQSGEPKIDDVSTGALYFITRQHQGISTTGNSRWSVRQMTGRLRFTD
nr:capsid protein [Tundra vole stool-associated circular virus]